MDEEDSIPRSDLAYEVARRLIYLSGAEFQGVSPVKGAAENLDRLLVGKDIPESEHRQLALLLQSLEGCDLDRCERIGDLVQEVSLFLDVWPEEFPTPELERLRDLL